MSVDIKTRVLVVDDHSLVRRSIQALIDSQADMMVVGTAVDGLEAVSQAEALRPAVVVMDISMPGLDGIHATARIVDAQLPTQVIILSMNSNAVLVRQALKCGAKGYILKQYAADELPQAIRDVARGNTFFSPAIPDVYFLPK